MINSLLQATKKLMFMSDEVWQRHANPWSGWTRVLTFPFFILAFWSRIWLGIYFLIPVGMILLWTWLNPRIFPKPKSTNHWISKGVFGEKIFTDRKKEKTEISHHHIVAANLTTVISLIGLPILIYGLVVLEIWPTLLGATIAILGKMWFVDRMAWLYEDMKDATPEYKRWLY